MPLITLSAASASRVGAHAFTDQSDDRVVVDHVRRLFAVADGSGPTYGGYYAPLGMEAGLASLQEALSPERHSHRCDAACLGAAFGAAQERMGQLDADYQRELEREARRSPAHRLEASLRASQTIARTRLGRTLDTFAHFYASVTALHFTTEESVVVAQVGSCRAYRWRRQSLELLVADHTFGTVLRAEGRADEADVHAGLTTRLLGTAPTAPPDIRSETVEAGDRYVLCSDGVWSTLSEASIAYACREGDAQSVASSLSALSAKEPLDDDASLVVVVAESRRER